MMIKYKFLLVTNYFIDNSSKKKKILKISIEINS